MFKIALVLSAIAATADAFASIEKEKGVSLLKDANFSREINKNDYYMVMFTQGDNCEDCDKMKAPFARAARAMAKKDIPVEFGKVDVSSSRNEKLAKRFNVQQLPTLYWISKGTESLYNGEQTSDDIVQWLTRRTTNPFDEIRCNQIEERIIDDKINAIYFGDQKGKLFQDYRAAATALTEYSFYAVDEDCANEHGFTDGGSKGVAVYRDFDDWNMVKYEHSQGKLEKWLQAESNPPVFAFTEQMSDLVFKQKKSMAILFLEGDSPIRKVYEEAAAQLKGDLLFAYSGVVESYQKEIAHLSGVNRKNLPKLRVFNPLSNGVLKYRYEGDVNEMEVEDVVEFIQDYKRGVLKPFYRSLKPPAVNDGPIKIVVGKTYPEFVLNKQEDVLVLYTAEWCKECKKVEHTLLELAKHCENVKDLVIAKYDVYNNENEGLAVDDFPTVRFHAANTREVVALDTTKADNYQYLQHWIEENSHKYRVAFNLDPEEETVEEPENLGELESDEEEEEVPQPVKKVETDEETVEL